MGREIQTFPLNLSNGKEGEQLVLNKRFSSELLYLELRNENSEDSVNLGVLDVENLGLDEVKRICVSDIGTELEVRKCVYSNHFYVLKTQFVDEGFKILTVFYTWDDVTRSFSEFKRQEYVFIDPDLERYSRGTALDPDHILLHPHEGFFVGPIRMRVIDWEDDVGTVLYVFEGHGFVSTLNDPHMNTLILTHHDNLEPCTLFYFDLKSLEIETLLVLPPDMYFDAVVPLTNVNTCVLFVDGSEICYLIDCETFQTRRMKKGGDSVKPFSALLRIDNDVVHLYNDRYGISILPFREELDINDSNWVSSLVSGCEVVCIDTENNTIGEYVLCDISTIMACFSFAPRILQKKASEFFDLAQEKDRFRVYFDFENRHSVITEGISAGYRVKHGQLENVTVDENGKASSTVISNDYVSHFWAGEDFVVFVELYALKLLCNDVLIQIDVRNVVGGVVVSEGFVFVDFHDKYGFVSKDGEVRNIDGIFRPRNLRRADRCFVKNPFGEMIAIGFVEKWVLCVRDDDNFKVVGEIDSNGHKNEGVWITQSHFVGGGYVYEVGLSGITPIFNLMNINEFFERLADDECRTEVHCVTRNTFQYIVFDKEEDLLQKVVFTFNGSDDVAFNMDTRSLIGEFMGFSFLRIIESKE
ncbi:hypothetical protein PCE1_000605 [Barthelona sp. PCE]